MNFLYGMNQAMQYIEENLTEEIDFGKAASFTGYSAGYFQRVFHCIADMTLTEYVKKRKMTLAALDLQNSNLRVIDLAMKYGYESADSFTRAFQSIHGVNPSVVRTQGYMVKSFAPIRFHISIEGAMEMKYRIEKRKAMRIVGQIRHYKAPKNSPQDVNTFWNEVFSNGMYEKIVALSNQEPKGVHGFLQVIDEYTVDYIIATVTDQKVPRGLEEFTVPESEWAIFEAIGPVQHSLEELWKRIFDEWFPSSNYQHAETMEIECFQSDGNRGSSNFHCEIWVPVRKCES